MSALELDQFFSGISMAACFIGLLILGLAFGDSLARGMAFGKHTLFMPGLYCTGMGILSLYIPFLTKSNN